MTRLNCDRAAGCEPASRGHIPQRGHNSRYLRQPLAKSTTHAYPRARSDQTSRVRMEGSIQQIMCRPLLHFASRIHHKNTVRIFCHHAEIMRNKNNGRTGFPLQFVDQLENLGLSGDVQSGSRFIRHKYGRRASKSNRDHRTLAHPAGQPMRIIVETPPRVRYPHTIKPGNGPLAGGHRGNVFVLANGLNNLFANRENRI